VCADLINCGTSDSPVSSSIFQGGYSSDSCSHSSLHFNPSLLPLRSATGVSLGGGYAVSKEWWAEVDTSTFVVCCGDVQASRLYHLFPIDLPVVRGDLISHEKDFSLFRTSFLIADRPYGGPTSPPVLAIPHSLGFPQGRPVQWVLYRNRLDHRRRWFKDFSRPILQAVVSQDYSSSFTHSAVSFTDPEFPGLLDCDDEEDWDSGARSSGDETLAGSVDLEILKLM
jgi:hypothetical protein